VSPEIVGRLAADVGFEQFEETAGDEEFVGLGGLGSNEMVGAYVVATTGALHVDIEDGVVHLAHDALGTGEDGCIVVQEG